MYDKLDKYLLILTIFLFCFINIGVAITATTLILDFNKLVKEQLIEIIMIVLFAVMFNYVLLSVYRE